MQLKKHVDGSELKQWVQTLPLSIEGKEAVMLYKS